MLTDPSCAPEKPPPMVPRADMGRGWLEGLRKRPGGSLGHRQWVVTGPSGREQVRLGSLLHTPGDWKVVGAGQTEGGATTLP